MVALAKLAVLSLVSFAASEEMSPIGKVLEMISGLQTKVIGEGEESHKIFAEYSEWCEDEARQLGFQIKTGKQRVEELTATIEKENSNIEGFNTKIEEIGAELATDEADLKAATEIREKEQKDFAAEEKELVEVIDTLKRAIGILEKEIAKSGGASMLQLHSVGDVVDALGTMVQASLLSSTDASKLTALLQSMHKSDEDSGELGAPDAAVYESKSGGIVDVLNDLLAKGETQLDGLRKTETDSLHNFEMLKQSLEDEIRFGEQDMEEAKKGLAASSASKAEAEGDLAATSKDLAADKETKATLHSNCMEKAEDFEAETKSRGEELKALATAKKVIQETTSGAEDQSYGLSQVSLVQLGLTSGTDLAQFEVVRLLRDLAQKHNSTSLAQLTMQVASVMRVGTKTGTDPFSKVKGLISEMIETLEKEAAADAEHKAFCDKELGENEAKEQDKISEIEKLSTKVDQWSAKSENLKEEVAELQSALAALAKSQKEMDKLREEEKALYEKNRPEMEKGLEGIKLALKVLNDYYSKEGKAHSSADGAGGGIIGLLQVCESDFSKNLAEMISTEEAAVTEYEESTKENALDKTNKEQDVKYKTKEAIDLDKATAEAKEDQKGVQKELDAVQAVLKSLHAECDEQVVPYEETKRRREAEIAGLKAALEVLEGEAVLLQQKSHSHKVRAHVAA